MHFFDVGSRCKTIRSVRILDVFAVFGFDINVLDCIVVISIGKFLVFVDREVFVHVRIKFAERNCDCEVALFEVCALRAAFGVLRELVRCRVVVVGVAVPSRICVRNECVIVGGYENVCVVVIRAVAYSVLAVFYLERCARPVASLEVLAFDAVHRVEVVHGFVIERANLEAEVDVDAGRVAVEVDGDTAGVLRICRVKFGQELAYALKHFAVAVREHTDEVRDKSFVESDRDEVVCDEQSAENDIENAPYICRNQTCVDFLVIGCRKGLCACRCRTAAEYARKIESVDNAV